MPERVKLTNIYRIKADPDVEFSPSGSKTLDLALGGGWAKRRVINIIGDSSTGKTLLCIEAAINFLRTFKKNSYVRYCEGEEAFSKAHAAEMGLPIDQVDFGEEPIQTVEDLYEEIGNRVAEARGPELIIVDSLDSLSSRAELKRSIDEASFATEKAKQMSALFRRINRAMSRKDITMLIVSQTRDNINASMYGRKWKRSGGNALTFYASQIVVLSQLRKLPKTVRGIERTVGIEVQAYIEKNKVGKPYGTALLPIIFDYGIDDERSCRSFLAKIGRKVSPKLPTRELHELVAREWQALETAFAPKRKKYG